jgi:hypothetical protein
VTETGPQQKFSVCVFSVSVGAMVLLKNQVVWQKSHSVGDKTRYFTHRSPSVRYFFIEKK